MLLLLSCVVLISLSDLNKASEDGWECVSLNSDESANLNDPESWYVIEEAGGELKESFDHEQLSDDLLNLQRQSSNLEQQLKQAKEGSVVNLRVRRQIADLEQKMKNDQQDDSIERVHHRNQQLIADVVNETGQVKSRVEDLEQKLQKQREDSTAECANRKQSLQIPVMNVQRNFVEPETDELTVIASSKRVRKTKSDVERYTTAVTEPFESGIHSIKFKIVKCGMDASTPLGIGVAPVHDQFNIRMVPGKIYPGISYNLISGKFYYDNAYEDRIIKVFGVGDVIEMKVQIHEQDRSLSSITLTENGSKLVNMRYPKLFEKQGPLMFTVTLCGEDDEVQIVD